MMNNTLGFALLLWFAASVVIGLWIAPRMADGEDER
jgi:hypothetical protein